ncbi:MAG: hypothetical protein KC620_17420 [Myxococcales bacterium]|nr:hypothetical protein [Myxococcales bacterium]
MSARRLPTLALAVALVAVGCGVEDAAQAPLAPDAGRAVSCPPLPDLAPTTFGLIEDGRLPGLRALLSERLTDAQVSAVVDALLRLLRDLDGDQLRALLDLTEHPTIAELGPLLRDLMGWVVGENGGTFRSAELAELRRLLAQCNGGTLFAALDAALTAPELPRLLADLGEILALDLVQQLLSAGDVLDRDGFTTLVCNILGSLIRPGFSVAGDIIEPLSGIDLLPLGEPPISTLLNDLDGLLSPDRPLLPAMADLVCCDVYGVQRCASLPPTAEPLPRDPVFTWALHALFTGQAIDINAALGSLGALADDPQVDQALDPVLTVLRHIADDDELRATLTTLLLVALDESTARQVLPELLLLVDSGGLDELLGIVRAVADGCDPDSLEAP